MNGSEEKIKDVYLRVGGDETSTGSTNHIFCQNLCWTALKEKGIKNGEGIAVGSILVTRKLLTIKH